MGYIVEINYFNSFWNKKVTPNNQGQLVNWDAGAVNYIGYAYNTPLWPGLPWNPTNYPTYPQSITDNSANWFIEESRIFGGYNNTSTDYGVRAYLVENTSSQQVRGSSIIYSGVFNNRTGVNKTNVFSIGDNITTSLNPEDGTIQKIYSEDTNLIVLQENKSQRILIDKDTIYTTEGGTQTQTAKTVVGQTIPYLGEYGISTNPESFAIYGGRKYYADKNRNAILRLSRDGITEISSYGMKDYFRDELNLISDSFKRCSYSYDIENVVGTEPTYLTFLDTDVTTPFELGMKVEFPTPDGNEYIINEIAKDSPVAGKQTIRVSPDYSYIGVPTLSNGDTVTFVKFIKDKIVGGWDNHNQNYVISLQQNNCTEDTSDYNTLSFDETINGWNSFYTYKPNFIYSLKGKYYTSVNSSIWKQWDNTSDNNRSSFYGVAASNDASKAYIDFIVNPNPSIVKNFQTVSYEGSSGWKIDVFESDIEQANTEWRSTAPFNPVSNGWIENKDISNQIYSYVQGRYETATPGNTGTSAVTPPFSYAGFHRKENRYVANLVSNSAVRAGEVVYGNSMSGIKGYFATARITTDNVTQPGGPKELFSVGTSFARSS
jgi:hypothetical protein